LDAIEPPDEFAPRFEAIKEQLAVDLQPDRLIAALCDIVDVLIDMWQQIKEERQEWDVFLNQLNVRFQELNKSLEGTEQQTMSAYYDGRKAESALERQVEDMQARLHQSSNVEQMKTYLHQRVSVMRAQLEDSQGKGAQLFASLQGQLNILTTTIRQMEEESNEFRRRYEQGEVEVLVDPLTGIASQLAFDQRLEQEFLRWKRYGSPMIIQLWSVDDFASLKDTYGAKVANKALQLIAKVMETTLREVDFIARRGGGQFVVLLPETKLENGQWVADRICRAVASSAFHHRGAPVPITMCCGYTDAREQDVPESMLQRAESALTQATSQGKNRYCAG
jgi:diguanylate cyclase